MSSVTIPSYAVLPSVLIKGEAFYPVKVIEIELSDSLPAVAYDGRHQNVFVIVRLFTEPVGACILSVGPDGIAPDHLGELLWHELRDAVDTRFVTEGLPEPCELTSDGLAIDSVAWPPLHRRLEVLASPPFISIVICTRDRVQQLRECLRQVELLEYPNFEVVVVDNAPTDDAARTLVADRESQAAYRYVVEPRGGLSWARNAGMVAANGEVIAFIDDDAQPDRHWLTAVAGGFAKSDDIGCVTGLILPTRLDTPAQVLFERLGGHSKGRGFSNAIFSLNGPQDPLYPRPAFGAGANMAFRREVLWQIGGFDVALGAGTPALAAEDTLAMTLTLLNGYRIAYEPAALVRHDHRRDLDGLIRQLHGYDVGLTAFYAALLRHRPSAFAGMLKLIPRAAGYMRKGRSAGLAIEQEFLRGITRQQWRRMLTGPVVYTRSAIRQRRVAASTTSPIGIPQ